MKEGDKGEIDYPAGRCKFRAGLVAKMSGKCGYFCGVA